MLTEEARTAMDGIYPAVIVTRSPEAIPNVTLLSQVWYVDDSHVALSYQFFNKTKVNLASNPDALVRLFGTDITPWDLRVTYIRTETEGTIFDQMASKLEGIASFMGMTEIFRLKGADIYRVLEVRECTEYWERDNLA